VKAVTVKAACFKVEFRVAVAQRILNGESVSSLSSQYKIKRSVLYRWRDAYRDKGKAGFGSFGVSFGNT
jgi:transposase-like protein